MKTKVIIGAIAIVLALSMSSCGSSNQTWVKLEDQFADGYGVESLIYTGLAKPFSYDETKVIDSYYVSDNAKDFTIRDTKYGIIIVRYNGKNKDIHIPETIDNKPVIGIDDYYQYFKTLDFYFPRIFYDNCNFDIENIYISKNIKYINPDSFKFSHDYDYSEESSMTYYDPKKNIIIDKDNPYYTVENGMLYTKDKLVLLENVNYSNPFSITIAKECKYFDFSLDLFPHNDYENYVISGYKGTVGKYLANDYQTKFVSLD